MLPCSIIFRPCGFFLALLLVLAANGVRATGIEDGLYRARVVVADDSEAARTGGFARPWRRWWSSSAVSARYWTDSR